MGDKEIVNRYIKPFRLIATVLFILIQGLLFYFIVFNPKKTEIHQYSAIVLCFLFGLTYFLFNYKKDRVKVLCAFAMFFTCVADYFLVLSSDKGYVNKCIGTSVFFIVQVCYFLFMYLQEGKKLKIINLVLRAVLSVGGIIACLIVMEENLYLVIISVVYYVNLLLNVVFSAFHFKRYPLLIFGLLFFSLCDLSVGISVGKDLGIFSESSAFVSLITNSKINLVWLFYLPSQVLLSLNLGPYSKT